MGRQRALSITGIWSRSSPVIPICRRRGWILTRSATPWDARAHQGKIGFSLPRRRLPLYFDDAKAAPRKGKSSRLKALGCCTSRQNSGPGFDEGVERGECILLGLGHPDLLECSSLYLILQTVPFWRWPVRC